MNFTTLFPDTLPNILGLACEEVYFATQAPAPLVLWGAVSATSLAVQRLVDVRLPIGAIRPTSLYMVAVAQSGERKSAIDRLFFAEFYERDRLETIAHQISEEAWRSSFGVWKCTREAIVSSVRVTAKAQHGESSDGLLSLLQKHEKEKPRKPVRTRTIVQDLTSTAFVNALEGERRSIGLITDEGYNFLNSDLALDATLVNKAWDGTMLSRSRGNNSETVALDPRVSLGLMVQPAVLEDAMRKHGPALRGSGFLPRCLICSPPTNQGFRAPSMLTSPMPALEAFQARLKLLIAASSGVKDRVVMEFDNSAAALWIQITNSVEVNLRIGGEYFDVADFANKSLENIGRVAAVLAYFEGDDKVRCSHVNAAQQIVFVSLNTVKELVANHEYLANVRRADQVYSFFLRESRRCNAMYVKRNHLLRSGPVRKMHFQSAMDILLSSGKLYEWLDNTRTKWISLQPVVMPAYQYNFNQSPPSLS